MKKVSRNCPVAFVVGAAGFIGSHLTEKLLNKGIQVIGVDDLSSGSKENLTTVIGNSKFHFINQAIQENFPMLIERIDYGFFVININQDGRRYQEALNRFIKLCQSKNARILIVSKIELYDSEEKGLENIRQAEQVVAELAKDKKVNARVVRLAPTFGPRMTFNSFDPVFRLIKASVEGKLQEDFPIDFTSRALFIDDACELIIKAMMHGGTAHKIYDGALDNPVKVMEIKQVLSDPLWHEKTGFIPTILPAWNSPNLIKTEKELGWKAKASLVSSLKETFVYFKERPHLLKAFEEDKIKDNETEIKEETADGIRINPPTEKKVNHNLKETFKRGMAAAQIIFLVALVGFALVIPFAQSLRSILIIPVVIRESQDLIKSNKFDQAINTIEAVKIGSGNLKSIAKFTASLERLDIFNIKIEDLTMTVVLASMYIDTQRLNLLANERLYLAFRSMAGEDQGDAGGLFYQAGVYFKEVLGTYQTIEADVNSGQGFFLLGGIKNILSENARNEGEDAKFKYSASLILTELLKKDQSKFLIVLNDNNNLNPGGGLVSGAVEVSIDKGRIKELKAIDIKNIDSQLSEIIKPPEELAKDLGLSKWGIKDSGFEPDYPTNASLTQKLYLLSTKQPVDGVVALDITTLKQIMELAGPIEIDGSGEEIKAENLLGTLKKVIYLPELDGYELGEILNQSLKEKHLMVYLSEKVAFNYALSNSWAAVMPKAGVPAEKEKLNNLLITEGNLMGNGINKYLSRKIELNSSLDEKGILNHYLLVTYQNNKPSENQAADKYKFRFKIYLDRGVKLTKASFNNKDILTNLTNFSDYGMTGYSSVLEVLPTKGGQLELEYQDQTPLVAKDKFVYKQTILKQIGSLGDPLHYTLSLPNGLKAEGANSGRQVEFNSDLSVDRLFEIRLEKI